MKIGRRTLLGIGLGVVGGAAVGAVAFAGPGTRPAAPVPKGAAYAPGPGDPRLKGPGEMIMQMNGKWHSHLLPFGAPAPDLPTLSAQLKQARARRLFI